METFDQSVMIALLPTETNWCRIAMPHMTLVYAGKKEDLPTSAFNELAKDACSIAQLTTPISLKVASVEVFGNWSEDPKDQVDVMRFETTPKIQAMRRVVERWNKSEWPFRPHVTIGPTGEPNMNLPEYLLFDRICVGWGDEYLTFWLKK